MEISTEEVEEWIVKTDELERTVRGIADGTIDPDKIGREQAREEERRRREREAAERRERERERHEAEEERMMWWNGAVQIYGPIEESPAAQVAVAGDKDAQDSLQTSTCERHEMSTKMRNQYSSDYSRWADGAFTPDDPATKEDDEDAKQLQEEKQNEMFESKNKEWCHHFKQDLERRNELRSEKQQASTKCRLKGNQQYKKKQYGKALDLYKTALEGSPYEVHILMNMALCYGRLRKFHDSLEYCNRAIHIDKSCVKAIFQRSKAYSALDRAEDAVAELEKALRIDPNNEEIIVQHDNLRRSLVDDEIERRVLRITNVNHTSKRALVDRKDGESDWSSLSNHNEIEEISHDNFDAIERFLGDLRTATYANTEEQPNTPEQRTICPTSLESEGQRVSKLIHTSQMTRVYMRTSGRLHEMCELLKICLKTNSDHLCCCCSIIFQLLSECITREQRSKAILFENGALEAAKCVLNHRFGTGQESISTKVAACKLIAVGLDVPVVPKFNSLFIGDDQVVCSTSLLLAHLSVCSSDDVILIRHDGVRTCCDLITRLSDGEKAQKAMGRMFHEPGLLSMKHPLAALLIALSALSSGSPQTKDFKETRRIVLDSISALSMIREIRSSFVTPVAKSEKMQNGSLTAVRVLLALSRSYKSDYEASREVALVGLTNATVASHETLQKATNGVKEAIIASGGIPILVGLITSTDAHVSPNLIKLRASGLLGRCISSETGMQALANIPNAASKLGLIYAKIVLNDKWATEEGGVDAELAVNLIRIIAEMNDGSLPKVDGYIDALVRSLPEPRRDSRGHIADVSVCQPPVACSSQTARSKAMASSTFLVNVTKALINCHLDSATIMASHVVEHLVCLLSNSSSVHPMAMKNAAVALARIMRSCDESVTNRCRELRGMEILVELGKAGKV